MSPKKVSGKSPNKLNGNSPNKVCAKSPSKLSGKSPNKLSGSPLRHGSASSPSARAELLARKRNAQLHRVLLPDAPPRKRRALFPSPERSPCVFVDEIKSTPPEAGTQADQACLESVVEIQSTPPESGTQADQACLESVVEIKSTPPEGIQADQAIVEFILEEQPRPESGSFATVTSVPDENNLINIEIIDEMQCQPGSSNTSESNVIGVNENDLVIIFKDWFSGSTVESDDEDLNVDAEMNVDGMPLQTLTPRTTFDQCADDTGLSNADLKILRQEEESSDLHVRQLASSNDYFEFSWSDDSQTFKGQRETFTGKPGPTFKVTNSMRVTDVFYKMFDTGFLDLLVTETNRYAEKALATARMCEAKNSRILRWTPTDRHEMVAFLAIIILQGLYPKVKEEAYFSFDGFGTMPYFPRIMSYNRYHLLKMFHHFVDNDTTTDRTKLCKIRPVIDYLNDKFSSLYYPSQNIVIDESLLKWQGRLSFAQKIQTKAAKVGVKTYELCESSTGYLYKFFVYTGKDGSGPSVKPDEPVSARDEADRDDGPDDSTRDETDRHDGPPSDRPDDSGSIFRPSGAIAKIVYDLLTPLLHKGHTLIMDNFYNSPLLARCLKRDGRTDVYGTLHLSREFVPDELKTLTKKDMRLGEIAVTYCPDLAVMLWRDNNLVSMISTYHPLQIGTKQTNERIQYRPAIVLDYNKSMGGVDRKDQFLASQPLERTRNQVWYKKLFRRLFNAALFNCFVIFTSNPKHKMSHRRFRTVLAEDLLKIHRQIDLTVEPRLLVKKPMTTTVKCVPTASLKSPTKATAITKLCVSQRRIRPYVVGNHFPQLTGSYNTRCWVCRENKKPSRTSYRCEECQVNLCIIGCFKAYHKPPT